MEHFARTGFVAVLLSSVIGLQGGCGSSDSSVLKSRVSDGGLAGSSSMGAGGGGGQLGGGGGASNAGGTPSGGANSGGGAGGAAPRADAGPTPCSSDAVCTPLGLRCDAVAGRCVECLFDNECAQSERCISGACETLQTCVNSNDCRPRTDGRTICDTTTKLCVQCAADTDCQDHQVCAVDTCVDSATCTPGSDAGGGCATGLLCTAGGKCVQCAADTDCTVSGEKCIQSFCRKPCTSDNQCNNPLLCDPTLHACVACTADKDCADIEHCADGECKKDVCAQGVKSCVGDSVVECTANGDGILKPVACTAGEKCAQKSGTSAVCEVPRLPDGGTPPPATCADKTKNGDETDVDCGGACAKCPDGKGCALPKDCANAVCQASCSGLLCFPGTRDKVCRAAACNDSVQNGAETDVNCGGGSCARCPIGDKCKVNADCEADVCKGGLCVAAQCTAGQCPSCFLPTDKACCQANGLCGCATTFPFAGPCQ